MELKVPKPLITCTPEIKTFDITEEDCFIGKKKEKKRKKKGVTWNLAELVLACENARCCV
jgi:hypothetical protein